MRILFKRSIITRKFDEQEEIRKQPSKATTATTHNKNCPQECTFQRGRKIFDFGKELPKHGWILCNGFELYISFELWLKRIDSSIHDEENDATRPNICNFGIVALLLNDFGGDIAWCSTHSEAGHGLRNHSRETKICELFRKGMRNVETRRGV